ncbi:hypothetical protein Micbo1qcDRAFT_157173 [Microdochium bolleyi]|uniref:Peptidase A1 domain-containing protein n=1 Tax=Microdochium bolleyi TaxID=196109 RepID=A0A136JDT0_9PEZI|nr:hypothetical protein Micbo1qcDRAFT_157173 [Microdochium bolleyi]
MRGLVRAAAIVLATAVVAHPLEKRSARLDGDNALLPLAFIDLDVTKVVEDVLIPRTLLAFDVTETDTSCGRSNITLDGNTLHEDEDGVGSGTITTKHGTKVDAQWRLSCVQVDDRQTFERTLNFNVVGIDGSHIQDLGFKVQFQQVAPVGVSVVDGAFSVIRVPTTTSERYVPGAQSNKPFTLQSELYELEIANARLARLEFEIASREFFIAHAFPESKLASTPSIADCTDLKCFASTLYDAVRSLFFTTHHDGFHRDEDGSIIIPPAVPEGDEDNVRITSLHSNKQILQVQNAEELQATLGHIVEVQASQAQSPITLSVPPVPTPGFDDDTATERPPQRLEEPWHPSTAVLTENPLKTVAIAGSALLLFICIIFATRAACTEKAIRRRAARCARRKEWREKREARVRGIKTAFSNACSWLHERTTRRSTTTTGGDLEKDAAVRQDAAGCHQGHEEHVIASSSASIMSWSVPSPSQSRPQSPLRITTANPGTANHHYLQRPDPESDEESTTMSEDLAHFRAVAGLMENLLSAARDEGGIIIQSVRRSWRSRRNSLIQQRGATASYSDPPSPTSTVPDYTSSDETLPSYDSSTESGSFWA